ncbi:KN motif and ankyrin repeat domain-containing protein 3 isoform X1 [Apis mellifera carnica]|nr:KN motif and ankyrin repeat domain-containing protein 3 isoform X1 [Apis mellifera carnica]
MALTVVPSARVFNGNVGTQAYVSGSTGSKCLCCPYGYHIDLDFVRYCEAVAAGSAGDRSSIERRKKRERRRQCQSMEVLLGLVSPALVGIEAELPKIPQEAGTNGATSSSLTSHDRRGGCTQESPALDLSDVVGDFEATLKRSTRPSKTCDKQERTENDGTNTATPVQNNGQSEHAAGDFDNASVGSGNSNLSTGALQNIREQMAASLERMRELEEQVKAIPMLQVQVSVLKEEKRNLLRQVDELSKASEWNESGLHRYRSQSFSEQRGSQRNLRNAATTPTRDMGTMCGAMTRDVGVSHQQVRTRDIGMITSTPIKRSLERSQLQIEEIVPETKERSALMDDRTSSSSFDKLYSSDSRDSWRSSLTRSQLVYEEIIPEARAMRNRLKRSPLQTESIPPTGPKLAVEAKKFRDVGVNTRNRLKHLVHSRFVIEDIAPEIKREVKRRSCGTTTGLSMKDILTKEDVAVIVDDALRIYKGTLIKDTISRGCQCALDQVKIIEKKDEYVQVAEPFKMRTNVGVTVKPRVSEIGIEVRSGPGTRTVACWSRPVHRSIALLALVELEESFVQLRRRESEKESHHQVCERDGGRFGEDHGEEYRHFRSRAQETGIRRQFKRQDTYTKIPAAGVIRYDSDNKEQYDNNNRIQQLQGEKGKDEKSEEIYNTEKQADDEEKHELPESALFQPIQEKPRKKVEPSKEMQAAMKVLNDSLKKSPSKNISHQMKNAINIIQQEWFKISSTVNANPLEVEDYLDCFEECSSSLLEYIVNMTDSSGNTAMHYAVSHGNFDVVSILLDSKVCDINKANVAGYTAVMLAALAEVRNSTHASVANKLFQLADVNIRAKLHGQTALMLAVSHGRKDMTQLLLDAGAAVNIQDEDGSTALMCAAEHGHTDIVRLLLAHPDCDPSIVDIDGSSALKIALEAGNRDIGVLLYAHERVNRGTSPYSSMRRNRRGSKPTTPTGPSPSAPVSPAPSRRIHSSTVSLNSSKYSAK